MKIIGNSLEAKVSLTSDDSEIGFLNDNLELIKKVLIVSELNISKGTKKDLEILIEKTTNEKCQRCWMYYNPKDFSKSDKNICKRCEEQLKI